MFRRLQSKAAAVLVPLVSLGGVGSSMVHTEAKVSGASKGVEGSSVVGTANRKFYAPSGLNRKVLTPLALEKDFDVAVIGGGIIGLATANEILRRFPNKRVVVLEKEGEVAGHQTGHNSGVIHAGMYYVPGSTMAQTCVRGAELMYAYCAKHRLPHERTGKLIVASTPAEHKEVELLYDRGTKNGVKGLRILNGAEVRAMEPAVSAAHSALWSPNTGVVDYGVVARSMAADVFESGRGDVRCGFGSRWVPGVLRPDLKTILCTVPPAPGGLPGNVTIRLRIDPLPEDQGSALLVYCKPSAAAPNRAHTHAHLLG
jgi:hypothetical protein